jgi:UDP-N-acetylglucosamine acyltransferase
MLFASEGTLMERVEDVDKMFPSNALVQSIVSFIRAQSDRSLCVPRNGTAPA